MGSHITRRLAVTLVEPGAGTLQAAYAAASASPVSVPMNVAFGNAACSRLRAGPLPTTTAVADIVDNVAAFADSPAILLLPIGAGAVVAGLIIFVLVKAAG